MTGRISDFGSLAERTGGVPSAAPAPTDGGAPATERVRHAWLDGEVPVLVARWRRTSHGGWEGLVVGVTEHGPAATWVIAARLRPVVTAAPETDPPASARVGGEASAPVR